MSSAMMNVISSTTLIEERRINFLSNRYFARDTARSVISQIFDIIDCLENLKHFKLLNKNIPELVMYANFIETVPNELLESSRWLREYKIYNDINMADFKATTLTVNHLMDDLFTNSLKISTHIGTWENKSLLQKLEKVKDVIHWSAKELDDEIKLNLAYQTFPKIKINILSGREVFADQFIGNILEVAAELVSHRGLVKPSVKGSDLENIPISELCCHCEISANTIDNIIEEILEKVTEESHEEEDVIQEEIETHAGTEEEIIQEKMETHTDITSATIIYGHDLTKVIRETSKTLEEESIMEELKSVAGETEQSEDVVQAEERQLSTESSVDSSPFQHYPLIRDFTIQKGKTLVEEIVSKWCFDAEWMYFIRYHDYSHDKCTEFHKYEVIFSIPTPSYPIPQATASVFFTITINRLQHGDVPVEMSFNLEGSSYIHHPEADNFNQDWLYAILCNKIKFFKRICSLNTI